MAFIYRLDRIYLIMHISSSAKIGGRLVESLLHLEEWALTTIIRNNYYLMPFITERKDKDQFRFQQELSHAAETGTLADDIKAEIDKMLAADLIILQFPMYWLGMPAILKGWIDRCFAETVVFDTLQMKWFDNGPFVNKKVVLSFTTGGTEDFFSNTGIFGDMDVILWPLQVCIFQPTI